LHFKVRCANIDSFSEQTHGIPAFVALSMNLGFVPMRLRCVRVLV
jgi:hypothetical protein